MFQCHAGQEDKGSKYDPPDLINIHWGRETFGMRLHGEKGSNCKQSESFFLE
jgi:hypothetical protein